jgi:hypothetical protein
MSQQQQETETGKVFSAKPTKEQVLAELAGTDVLREIMTETQRRSGEAGVMLTGRGTEVADYQAAIFLAEEMAAANMVPKAFIGKDGRANIPALALAMLAGRRVGLDALASVQSIMVVGGIPSLWGGAPLAICQLRPDIWDESRFEEWWEVDGERVDRAITDADLAKDTTCAVATVARVGGKPYTVRFSVRDAKRAGLWSAEGKLYGKYPLRMLKHRPLGYAINDRFKDLLLGLAIKEVGAPDREDDEEEPQPARTSVLDRVAASAPGAAQVDPPAEPVAKVDTPLPATTAPVAIPPELADLVPESKPRAGQDTLDAAAIRKAVADQQKPAEVAPAPAAESDSGEPELAKLNAESLASLEKWASSMGVPAAKRGGLAIGSTRPGCYDQVELRAALKSEMKEGLPKPSGAI